MYKIAVLHRYPPAQVIGTNASYIEFLKELSSLGCRIFYITYKDNNPKPEIPYLTYVTLPFVFNRGDNRDKLFKTVLWILLAPFYVLYLQIKFGLHLVYCDDSVPYYGFLSKLISPFSKVVIRLGDLQTGYYLADRHPNLFKLAIKAEKLMWDSVDGIVAISDAFKRYLKAQGVKDSKVSVVEESINLEGVSETPAPVRNGHVLFHGALLGCKGIDVLLDAFKEFKQNHKDKKLVIAGGGPEEDRLKSLVREKGIQDVTFTGWYDHKKLKEIMSEISVSIVMRSPNIANNFVVTTCLLENWRHGKPVIAPDLEAFKGVIKDGVNGILFKAGDALDLAGKMNYIFNSEGIWQYLVTEGFKTAKEVFDHKKISKKMTGVLLNYMERKG